MPHDAWKATKPKQEAGEDFLVFLHREHAWKKSVGEECYKCGHWILFGHGYRELCSDCKSLRDYKGEVSNNHAVRCPKCKHEMSGEDLYDTNLWEEGDHEVMCQECEHEFTVSTSITYTFHSPELVPDEPEPEDEDEEEESEEPEDESEEGK